MTSYIKLSTLQYPLHEGDIRNEHPEIKENQTWPNFPLPQEYAWVEPTKPPIITPPLEYYYEGKPEIVDGKWKMTWLVGKFTQEEWDSFLVEKEKMLKPKKPSQNFKPEDLNKSGSAPDVIG